MPTRQYAEPAQRVLASAPYGQMPLWGIKLSHPEFSDDHYLINRPFAMDLTHEDLSVKTYLPCYFQIVLPKIDGKGQQDLQLSIQNVDRMIVDELELAMNDTSERITVELRYFLEDAPDAGPQNVPMKLSISQVNADNVTVTGVAGRPDTLNRVFPAEIYRTDLWPGLNR